MMSSVIAVGALSALLVIPQVRAVAGGILASSAVIGLIVGFAARSTLANFIAGILIALRQPLRLGDWVEVGGVEGTVEEIGLTYTCIRARDHTRLVIPNEKLASDTIRNYSIVGREKLAEVTVQVSLDKDLEAVLDLLREEASAERHPEVLVSALDENAIVILRALAPDARAAERLESDLRLRVHGRLRAGGFYA